MGKMFSALDEKPHMIEVGYHCSLVGANLERANLRYHDLRGVNLTNANCRNADFTGANLEGSICIKTDFSSSVIQLANFSHADLSGSDFTQTYGRRTNFSYAKMWNCYLHYCIHKGALYIGTDLDGADLGFSCFLGAKFDGANLRGVKNAQYSNFVWWRSPFGLGKISYEPLPGWILMEESQTGGVSVRENAAREPLEDTATKTWRLG
jgi:hypothetical protein